MSDRYNPPEDQIEKVLRSYSPRQIAIAYLRASRRARNAESAFHVLDKIQSATVAATAGDYKTAKEEMAEANQRLRGAKNTHT